MTLSFKQAIVALLVSVTFVLLCCIGIVALASTPGLERLAPPLAIMLAVIPRIIGPTFSIRLSRT